MNILLIVFIAGCFAQDNANNKLNYAGCQCCGEPNSPECASFESEWNAFYACVDKVPEYVIEKYDINWFYIPRQTKFVEELNQTVHMNYSTCQPPTGFNISDPAKSADLPYAHTDPCVCLEDFADRVKTSYNCSAQFMEAMDEVCNNIGCGYCDFVSPKCGTIQKRRCDLVYQREISWNTEPTPEDSCRALNKKVQCYIDNNCGFEEEGMQQAVKQCRKDACTECYHICENNAFFTFALLALVLVFVVF